MRVKMSEKYITEREEICKKIIDILQLDSEGFFYIHELDENIDKQNQNKKTLKIRWLFTLVFS